MALLLVSQRVACAWVSARLALNGISTAPPGGSGNDNVLLLLLLLLLLVVVVVVMVVEVIVTWERRVCPDRLRPWWMNRSHAMHSTSAHSTHCKTRSPQTRTKGNENTTASAATLHFEAEPWYV